jgi:hypothetical protein
MDSLPVELILRVMERKSITDFQEHDLKPNITRLGPERCCQDATCVEKASECLPRLHSVEAEML